MKKYPSEMGKSGFDNSKHAQITENLTSREHDGGFGVGFMGQPIGILSFITLLMSTQD